MHRADWDSFLQLLEDHLKRLRDEEAVDAGRVEDDEAEWDGWNIESDSSGDDSESEGWIAVDSDSDGDLKISDSEDESKPRERLGAKPDEGASSVVAIDENVASHISTLATTKVCSPSLLPER